MASVPGPELSAAFYQQGRVEPPPVVRKVLPNGLTVLVQEDHSHPLVGFQAVVRTGSATEGSFMGTGVSHVVEHMLFKGTARRPVGAVEREAQSYGGTAQGFTTYDTTSYQIVVNREFWSQTADLMVDALFFPSMAAAEFTKERQVVLRELKLRDDDPGQMIWEVLFENAYRVHPYHVPIIGYEPLLTSLTREEVVQYHRSRYLPNAIVIAVAGDVDAEQVVRRIEDLTSGIQPGRIPPQPFQPEPAPVASREVTQEADLELGIVSIGFPGVAVSSEDVYALDLLAWLLGGGRGSRLDTALKEPGIVHAVSCWDYTPQQPGLFVVTMRMDPDRISKAVEAAFQEMARCQQELFSAAELESAKRVLVRGYLESRQTVAGQASDLAGYEVLVGDPQFAYRYLEGVRRATPEDLRRVAVKYLLRERSTTVKLQPKGTLSFIEKAVSGTSSKLLVEKVVLDNGMRILLRQDRRLPLVTFQVSVMGGVRYETERNNGMSALTAKMLLRGTRKQDALELTHRIKEMGADLEPFHGRNSLGLTLELVGSESARGLQLLAEVLLEPTFPAQEMEKERRLALAEIKASEEDPFSWGLRRMAAALFSIHPYRFDPLGDPESVAVLSRENLVDFHRRILDPRKMVLSVVGDFRRDELLPLMKDSFGRLQAPAGEPFSVPQEPPLDGLKQHQEVTSRKEGLILVGYRGLRVGDPKVPVLDLLEAVLSGGAGRLFTEVRERLGLAYTVGAFSIHGVDPGAFLLYAVTDPSELPTVQKALLDEIRDLSGAPVSQEELDRAREGLLGARRIARQAQASLAAQMSMDELYGLGYDFPERYEAQVRAATPQDLQQVAKTLLESQPYALVIGRPADGPSAPSVKKPLEKPAAVTR